MERDCAICSHLGNSRKSTITVLGVLTTHSDLLAAATTEFATPSGERHVVLPVCPEHAVDIYRGRVSGVAMAWRLPDGVLEGRPGPTAGRTPLTRHEVAS